MVEFGTYNPFVSGTTSFIPGPMPPPNNCISIGKVHHFHRQKIECLDTKTINSEDLPLIEVCCRCQFEQNIQSPKAISIPTPQVIKTRREISKFEREQADNTMRIYNEKRKKRLQQEALRFAKK